LYLFLKACEKYVGWIKGRRQAVEEDWQHSRLFGNIFKIIYKNTSIVNTTPLPFCIFISGI